jgi:hypothetical protein
MASVHEKCTASSPVMMAAASGENRMHRASRSQIAICVNPTAPTPISFPASMSPGFHRCEHHFKNARGLFLNNGARHVHAIDHGGHRKQQGHHIALPERGFRIAS